MKLNLEQLSYLKGLDSKKKQRKFLLDCLIENLIGESRKSVKIRDLPVIEKRGFDESDYIDNENHLCWIFNILISYGENPNFDYMIKLKEIALNYSELKRENFKNDHENLLSKMEETSNEVLSLKSANLSIDQISAVVNWMNGYEQLKDTVIPIRFREDAQKKEIFNKSNEPQTPMNFCVEITDENKIVLNSVWKNFNGHNRDLSSNYRFLNSNSGINYLCPSFDLLEDYINISTDEFLTYIGREDLIERKSVNIENPKQEEKVDLSKELYWTSIEGDVVRILNFDEKRVFGFCKIGGYPEREGLFMSYLLNKSWEHFADPNFWRKSTPQEIKSMLIKKLEADGFKHLCKFNNREIYKTKELHTVELPSGLKDVFFLYIEKDDELCLDGITMYKNGKFAKIIPQEELTKNNEYELVNSSDEIKNMIVVDFENVSEKID